MKFWIARNETGELVLFEKKPKYFAGIKSWGCNFGEAYADMWDGWFPEITFENSPQEVEIKLK